MAVTFGAVAASSTDMSRVTLTSRPGAGRGPAAPPPRCWKALTEYFAENVFAGAAAERIGAAAAELEVLAAWTATWAGLLAAETGEGIAACAAATLETLETRLALGIDLAAVEGRAGLLVADDLIGLIGRGEAILGLGIVGILVRMVLLGELAVSRLYVLGRGVLGNAQHLIGIAHRLCLRFLVTVATIGGSVA